MTDLEIAAPLDLEGTRVRRGVLEDLALKILYLNNEMSLLDLSERMCLSLEVVQQIFGMFRKEQLCEVKGMTGGTHRITATQQGKARAADLLGVNQYAGPAPVSLMDYELRVRGKSVQQTQFSPEDLKRAFHPMVLGEDLVYRIGKALVSGSSIFLYGPAGTGKTSVASRLGAIYRDNVLIPYAVEVEGQIITVYDPGLHRRGREEAAEDADRRWVICERPRIAAGGELCGEMLDLQYNSVSHYYAAPLQMKANNGVLILDDFGRQKMRPEELLNRWMTPLDRRVDFLTLHGGKKFDIPFDMLVVFATNLDPAQLTDEAFLRRIPNKIRVDFATPEQFMEIFRLECETRLLDCAESVLHYVVKYVTQEMKQPLAQCYARDLINQIVWAASYLAAEPVVTAKSVEQACRDYFLPASKPRGAAAGSSS